MEEKLNTQLIAVTLGDLVEVLKPLLGIKDESSTKGVEDSKMYVHGVKGLAKLLNCSISTAQRRISSGLLDGCIVRTGRIIMIDREAALQILKGGRS